MLKLTAHWHKLCLNKSHPLIVSIGSLNALFSGNYKKKCFCLKTEYFIYTQKDPPVVNILKIY